MQVATRYLPAMQPAWTAVPSGLSDLRIMKTSGDRDETSFVHVTMRHCGNVNVKSDPDVGGSRESIERGII